jgi:hypothetical protein
MNKKLKDSTQGELFWMLVVLAIFVYAIYNVANS